jgi:putative NADPH-quinone reductase
MKRLALNASPRGKESNSRLIIDWISQGLASDFPVLDIARVKDSAAQIEAFLSADEAVIVMPLYTDQAPGIFMNFIDALADALAADPDGTRPRLHGKRVGFVIQSGFPESIHSEALRDWLLRLSERLGFHCMGVAIKAGAEGIRLQPERTMKGIKASFMELGKAMARGQDFPPAALARLASFRTFGFWGRLALSALAPTGLLNFYWNYMLRKHGAYERRFDAPYQS